MPKICPNVFSEILLANPQAAKQLYYCNNLLSYVFQKYSYLETFVSKVDGKKEMHDRKYEILKVFILSN